MSNGNARGPQPKKVAAAQQATAEIEEVESAATAEPTATTATTATTVAGTPVSPIIPVGYSGLSTVVLEIPLAEPPDNQTVRVGAYHVDCQLRDRHTRETFTRIWAGLDKAGARMKDGRRVTSYADAIRFLIEQVEKTVKENGGVV